MTIDDFIEQLFETHEDGHDFFHRDLISTKRN
jgi:hypothetical protein